MTSPRNPAQTAPPGAEPAPKEVEKTIEPSAQWKCTLSKLDAEGKPAGALESITVGQRFELDCEGPAAKLDASGAGLSLLLPKEHKYVLKILETRGLTDTACKFIATSYVSGDIKLKNPVLTDGLTSVGLGDLQFTVESVITPENNPEGKPFGPWAAKELGFPLYAWIFIGVLVLIGTWAAFKAIRQSSRRKKFLAEVEKHGTALSPFNQFNKELRAIARKYPVSVEAKWTPELGREYMRELNQVYRWFLAREMLVPAFTLSAGKIARELKKIDRASGTKLQKEIGRELVLSLNEIDKSLASRATVSAEDAQQLTELCRKLADRIAKARAV